MAERKQIAGVWHVKVPCLGCGQLIWVGEKSANNKCTDCMGRYYPLSFDTGGGERVIRSSKPLS